MSAPSPPTPAAEEQAMEVVEEEEEQETDGGGGGTAAPGGGVEEEEEELPNLPVDFELAGGEPGRPVACYTCKTHEEITAGIKILRATGNPAVVGLDCEWNNHFIERGAKVALTQIGSTRVCLLIPMLNHKDFPKALVDFLADEKVVKTGVGIGGDVTRLGKDYGLVVKGVADIKSHKKFPEVMNRFQYGSKWSLEYMATCQGHDSWKTKGVQMSRWSRDPLRPDQKVYAANDALYSARILWGLYFLERRMEGPVGWPADFSEWLDRPRKQIEAELRAKEERKAARAAAAEARRAKKAAAKKKPKARAKSQPRAPKRKAKAKAKAAEVESDKETTRRKQAGRKRKRPMTEIHLSDDSDPPAAKRPRKKSKRAPKKNKAKTEEDLPDKKPRRSTRRSKRLASAPPTPVSERPVKRRKKKPTKRSKRKAK